MYGNFPSRNVFDYADTFTGQSREQEWCTAGQYVPRSTPFSPFLVFFTFFAGFWRFFRLSPAPAFFTRRLAAFAGDFNLPFFRQLLVPGGTALSPHNSRRLLQILRRLFVRHNLQLQSLIELNVKHKRQRISFMFICLSSSDPLPYYVGRSFFLQSFFSPLTSCLPLRNMRVSETNRPPPGIMRGREEPP